MTWNLIRGVYRGVSRSDLHIKMVFSSRSNQNGIELIAMTKTQLALAIEQTKLQQKQHEGKDAKKGKAKQVTYDAGMTKIAQSLAAQLRDVVWAFCLEVFGVKLLMLLELMRSLI